MGSSTENRFAPDYAIHPGEILEETLWARGMKKTEFAERCGLSPKTVSEILAAKAPVTPQTAIQFERVLGVSASIWNNLNATYDLYVARKLDVEELERQKAWAKRFPLNELVKRGFIESPVDPADRVRKLLDFFAVGSIKAWEQRFKTLKVAYRQSPSFECSPESVTAWLTIGGHLAENIECSRYGKDAFKASLENIKELTKEQPRVFEPKMKTLCSGAGVALAFVSELPKTRLSGAARWLKKDKALIMLSLRHKTDDHFWFSFFHEAGHILLHEKKRTFIDEKDKKDKIKNKQEDEADAFAANMLVPSKDYRDFTKQGCFTEQSIRRFAKRVGIAPGIVVGRLQHDEQIPYSWFNALKRTLVLVESGT